MEAILTTKQGLLLTEKSHIKYSQDQVTDDDSDEDADIFESWMLDD